LCFFFQESEGSDGESEYDDGANNEQDELISEDELEQEAVSDRVVSCSPLKRIKAHFFKGPSGSQMSPMKLSKVQQTAARQEKKQKRKAEEGKLHVRRQEMDKAKVLGDLHPLVAFL
jgi:SWI/SNF-related matrix-associated actin-dependent regulator of chromatin subfamily A member 5